MKRQAGMDFSQDIPGTSPIKGLISFFNLWQPFDGPFLNKGLLRHPVSRQLEKWMAIELAHPNSLITSY